MSQVEGAGCEASASVSQVRESWQFMQERVHHLAQASAFHFGLLGAAFNIGPSTKSMSIHTRSLQGSLQRPLWTLWKDL